jgi:hypothetical protein
VTHWIRPATLLAFVAFIIGGATGNALIALFGGKELAAQVATGAGAWLQVIPAPFYELISFISVGYIAAKSVDRFTDAKKSEAEAVREYSKRIVDDGEARP